MLTTGVISSTKAISLNDRYVTAADLNPASDADASRRRPGTRYLGGRRSGSRADGAFQCHRAAPAVRVLVVVARAVLILPTATAIARDGAEVAALAAESAIAIKGHGWLSLLHLTGDRFPVPYPLSGNREPLYRACRTATGTATP
jgi:hypothetical protein